MSSIVSIDTRGYDISMGPGMLRVGGGGGLAGNVYINGNVGIGVVNPTARLDVNGGITASWTSVNRSIQVIRNTTGEGASWNSRLSIVPYLGAGGYNALSSLGDVGIIWGAISGTNGNLVIAPHSAIGGGLKIMADGKVGIGTSSPAATLDVNGQINSAGVNSAGAVSVQNANGYIRILPSYPSGASDYTGYLEFLSPSGVRLGFLGNIQNTSNVGIDHMQMSFNNGTKGLHLIGTATDSTSTTTGQLKLDGGCGIAKSLTVGGIIEGLSRVKAIGYNVRTGSGGAYGGNMFNFNWTGTNFDAYVDNTFIATLATISDYRIKQNVNLWSDSVLEKIKKIPIITFNYKNFSIFKEDNETHIGFLAHELQEQFPQTVTGEKDGVDGLGNPQIQNINVLPLTTILIKAIQEQQTQIEQLQNQNKSLEQRLSLLEQRLSR